MNEPGAGRGGAAALEEITGMHGAFAFPERLLQRIWARGEFDARGLRLRDGRPLGIVRRGRWNHGPGPDFLEAEIRVGEGAGAEVLRGAIEVHLRATDWDQHGHASDPAYGSVILHVVLFPALRADATGAGGRPIPTLELLPLLERDLEAYAEEAAVEALAGRPFSQLREALASLPRDVLAGEVARHAGRRWVRKLALARRKLELLGWEAACHQVALEVLGYRFNREPMRAVAEAWPLAAWREGAEIAQEAWRQAEEDWVRGGVRPANHPRRRLEQYERWVKARPDWPARLERLGSELAKAVQTSALAGDLRQRRRDAGLARWRRLMAQEVAADALGGSRLDTMICDAWLPLLAAGLEMQEKGDKGAAVEALRRCWSDWRCGDAPAELPRLAGEFGLGEGGARTGLAQGELQGLLGWLAALPDEGGRGT